MSRIYHHDPAWYDDRESLEDPRVDMMREERLSHVEGIQATLEAVKGYKNRWLPDDL
jgi:hypothetical protein